MNFAASAKTCASKFEAPGASGDGFKITLAPIARAGATLCATRLSGKLKGVIAKITPRGVRKLIAESNSLPFRSLSSGIISPA